MSWEQRNADFCNAQTDAQMAYIEAEREVDRLQTENAKLRELVDAPKCETCEAMLDCDECLRADGSHKERRRLSAENAKLREEFDKMDVWHSKELSAAMAEIDKLRELVRDYERCTMHADCSRCEYDGKLSTHCPLSPCFPDADELRKLAEKEDEHEQD